MIQQTVIYYNYFYILEHASWLEHFFNGMFLKEEINASIQLTKENHEVHVWSNYVNVTNILFRL